MSLGTLVGILRINIGLLRLQSGYCAALAASIEGLSLRSGAVCKRTEITAV